jgi:hypothetical protein
MAKRTIMQATVVRESYAGDMRGQWWVMNKRETGWASFAYPHPTLADVLDKWDVRIVGGGVDKHSVFVEVVPA